jgi:hypothetical protein
MTTPDQLEGLATQSAEAGYPLIAEALLTDEDRLVEMLSALRAAYLDQLIVRPEARRVYKLAGFDVLELLTNDQELLCGFRLHFSNDERAEFVRTATSTMALNIGFAEDGSVHLNAGNLDALRQEWRINGKPLYEEGLPGRYNEQGQWKPLIFPGPWDEYKRLAIEASDRPEVQGSLLYCFLTGHHAFEFAARTSVELPHEVSSFGGGRLTLTKSAPAVGGVVIYDGTVHLRAADAHAVEEAIALVQALVNRIAFAFDAAVAWTPKYSTHHRGGTRATPSEEDLTILDHLIAAADRPVIDPAIDWYNRGQSSTNEFVAFLCAYIALESTAMAVWDGEIELKMPLARPSKAEEKVEASQRLEELLKLRSETDPLKFIEHAYFDCVVSLRRRIEAVATAVFGPDSPTITDLFGKRDGASLSGLRSDIAHGGVSLADVNAREIVRARLPEIQEIAREFLLRVGLHLSPDEDVPEWSRQHLFGVTMDDPRATLCTTSLDHLPPSDWHIRAEWIE